MKNLTTLLDQTLLGITLNRYAYALLAMLVALVGKKLFAYLLTLFLSVRPGIRLSEPHRLPAPGD